MYKIIIIPNTALSPCLPHLTTIYIIYSIFILPKVYRYMPINIIILYIIYYYSIHIMMYTICMYNEEKRNNACSKQIKKLHHVTNLLFIY